jgi:23S rRNA (cytosine1962-C5)-methyltransferase
MSRIILKPGKEKSLLRRHPWIFSGAIDTTPVFENGDILPVYSSSNELLAHAYFHTSNSIAGRILSFGMEDPVKTVRCKIQEAIALRQSLKIASSAYRIG